MPPRPRSEAFHMLHVEQGGVGFPIGKENSSMPYYVVPTTDRNAPKINQTNRIRPNQPPPLPPHSNQVVCNSPCSFFSFLVGHVYLQTRIDFSFRAFPRFVLIATLERNSF